MLARIDIRATGPRGAPVPQVTEGEVFRLSIQVLNADLAAATPTAARLAILDVDRGTPLLDWTAILPAPSYVTWVNDSSANITIGATYTAIRNGKGAERRQIVIECSDADGPIRRTFEFEVADLAGLT